MVINVPSDESKIKGNSLYKILSLDKGRSTGTIEMMQWKDVSSDKNTPRDRDIDKVIMKLSHKGRVVSPYHFAFDECLLTEIDPKDGVVIRVESFVKNRPNGYADMPEDYIHPLGCDVKNMYGNSLIDIREISDMALAPVRNIYRTDYMSNIWALEEQFDVPFNETFGALELPGLMSGLNLPMSANIIFDSHIGYKIDKIQVPELTKRLSPQGYQEQGKKFFEMLQNCYNIFSGNCHKYNQPSRLHMNVSPTGMITNGFLTKYPGLCYTHRLDTSDHCQALMGMEASYGETYTGSDLFYEMFQKYNTPMASLLDTDYEKDLFKEGMVTKYFKVLDPVM